MLCGRFKTNPTQIVSRVKTSDSNMCNVLEGALDNPCVFFFLFLKTRTAALSHRQEIRDFRKKLAFGGIYYVPTVSVHER